MFVALWEFEVKPGCEESFESVYGPEGDWAELFRRDAAYSGTRLLRDTARTRVYLTIDSWSSRQAYETFRTLYRAEYEEVDKRCAALTVAEKLIGLFESAE